MNVNHKDRDHALLSASGASRWIRCTPSARLEEQFPETESEYAEEGTLAHEICDITLKKELHEITEELYNTELAKKIKHNKFNKEMLDCAKYYVKYIRDIAEEREGEALILTEQRLDFSNYVEEGFGTGDCVLISEDILDVIDYKHGKGVPVSADDNEQMKCYALGALNMFGNLYNIKTIIMHIFQPRLDNISSFAISVEELLMWAETELKPASEKAYRGEGDYVAGSHCKFCRARNVCEARASNSLEIIKNDFTDVTILSDEQIEYLLPKLDSALEFLKDLKEYTLDRALQGKKWKGFKLVEGRSNRVYTDQDNVLEALKKSNYPEAIVTERKLLGISAMEKTIGKKEVEKILKDLIIKPKGKPTLVPISDKREEINLVDDFDEIDAIEERGE